MGRMSLEWPLTQRKGHVQPGHTPLQEYANSDRLGGAPSGPPHQRWRRDVLQPPEVPRPVRDTCVHIRLEAYDAFHGIREASQFLVPPLNAQKRQKHIYLTRLARKNDIICLQETHGNELLQAIHVLHTQFRMFGKIEPNNMNAGGSAILVHEKTSCQTSLTW